MPFLVAVMEMKRFTIFENFIDVITLEGAVGEMNLSRLLPRYPFSVCLTFLSYKSVNTQKYFSNNVRYKISAP